MIDRFAEKSSGLPSENEKSSEDSHPKRKERKITLRSPIKNVPKFKRTSSSSSEISEKEVEKAKTLKKKAPPQTLSSTEDSDGEIIPKKEKKSVVEKRVNVDKGKTLLGKKKIIKRGVPKKSPLKQPNKPNTTLSSDEDCALNDNKDSFTDYLGLQLKSDSENKIVKVDNNSKAESDDDIQCIKEIKVSPNGSLNNYSNSFVKSKSLILPRTPSKNSAENGSNKRSPRSEDTKDVLKIDDDSDTEPVNSKEEALKRNATTIKMLKKVSHKRSKRFSSNSNTDENRTSSDDKSDESEKKKILSDLELSGGTKELSSSCDSENVKVSVVKDGKTPSGTDDAVIVINEESEASNPVTNKRILSESSQDSIDSDEVTILCK